MFSLILVILAILSVPTDVYTFDRYYKADTSDLSVHGLKPFNKPVVTERLEVCMLLCAKSCHGYAYNNEKGTCQLLQYKMNSTDADETLDGGYDLFVPANATAYGGICTEGKASFAELRSYINDKSPPVSVPFQPGGVTITSSGKVAINAFGGSDVAVYSASLRGLSQYPVSGASSLRDIVSKGTNMFISDYQGYRVHVMGENGGYSHHIDLGWAPYGITFDVSKNHLFVVAYSFDKVYNITLDENNYKVGSNVVTLSGPPLDKPYFLHFIPPGKLAVTIPQSDTIEVASTSGTFEWSYGGYGNADGKLGNPWGITTDIAGQLIVADSSNKRLVLVSANGDFIKNLVTGMSGKPRGLYLKDNVLYVSQENPHMLITFILN